MCLMSLEKIDLTTIEQDLRKEDIYFVSPWYKRLKYKKLLYLII